MARPPVALSVTVSQKDVDRITKRLDKWQGKPLAARLEKATQGGLALLVNPIRAAAPGPGNELAPEDATGNLRRSVGVHKLKKRSGEVGAYAVGPQTRRKGRHRHLVIRGHETSSGTRTTANPFVSRAADPLEGRVRSFIDEQVRRIA